MCWSFFAMSPRKDGLRLGSYLSGAHGALRIVLGEMLAQPKADMRKNSPRSKTPPRRSRDR